jgi:hypothetical protein
VRPALPAHRGPALLTRSHPEASQYDVYDARSTVMPTDPYAVLRALLRAEAVRNTPKTQVKERIPQPPQEKRDR